MSKQKLLIVAVVALLFINLAMAAFLLLNRPQFPQRGQSREAGPRRMIVEQLGFNHRQSEQYDLLIEEHKITMQSLEQNIRRTKTALYRTLADDSGTQDALMEELGKQQVAIEQAHYKHFEEIRKLCTPEQRERYNKLTNELAAFFGRQKDGPGPRGEGFGQTGRKRNGQPKE